MGMKTNAAAALARRLTAAQMRMLLALAAGETVMPKGRHITTTRDALLRIGAIVGRTRGAPARLSRPRDLHISALGRSIVAALGAEVLVSVSAPEASVQPLAETEPVAVVEV